MADQTRSTPISQLPAASQEDEDGETSEYSYDADIAEEDDAGSPPIQRRTRESRYGGRGSQRDRPRAPRTRHTKDPEDEDDMRIGTPLVSGMISMLTSRAFLQALFLAFIITVAVGMSPLARMIVDRVPSIASVPYAETLICSLVSAAAVTVTRPPPV